MSMIDKFPYFYDNYITRPLQDSLEVEANEFHKAIADTLDQCFVETATHGLDKWERMLGIKKNNLPIKTRRENIKAKMRSRGTSSFQVIKNVCESFGYGKVSLEVDHANYSFTVTFIDNRGVPDVIEEIDRAVTEIKPCHLAHKFAYTYNTHADLSKFTHEQLTRYTHDELRNSNELRRG